MAWIPVAAWIAAGVIAVLVLGFCAFDLLGKVRRLQRDVGTLNETAAGLPQLQAQLVEAQRRLASTRVDG